MRYPSDKGFTLLELIVVLLVVAVAAAVAAVSINRAYEKGVLKEQAMRVHGVIRHARDRALLDRMPVTFVPDGEAGSYWLERRDGLLGKKRHVPPGIAMHGEPIVFFSKGNSTGGSITVEHESGRGYVIEVDEVTGTARVGRF
jgi:general secretion pathway protein H